MLAQYTLPEMEKIFSHDNRYQVMMDVTVVACEALADIGRIPMEAYRTIKEKAGYDLQRITELERETRNHAMAFLICVAEYVGPEAGRYINLGLSSEDIADTVLSLQVRQVSELLLGRLNQLRQALLKLANEYKYTLMMGRTHGTNAEPVTFGLKMAVWVKEIDRAVTRLGHARNVMLVGKMSGVTGTFSSVDPHVETFVCRRLGLHPAYVTTQVLQRDRLAEYLSTLAIIGSSLEKFAVEIRNLQRSDICEVEEAMAQGQMGSTALPHKRRPFKCETITGLSRVLRGNALAAMENITIWHEQDASHSMTEKIIVPDSCALLDYMLWAFTDVIENLRVYPDNMRRNIDRSVGLVFSQRVLIALMEKGVSREKAYDMVMKNAKVAVDQQVDFQFLILEDEDIRQLLSSREIMDLFDYDCFRKHIDYIFERAGLNLD